MGSYNLNPPWFQNEKLPFCQCSWKAVRMQDWDLFIPLPLLTACPHQADTAPGVSEVTPVATRKLNSLKSSFQQSCGLGPWWECCHLPQVPPIFTQAAPPSSLVSFQSREREQKRDLKAGLWHEDWAQQHHLLQRHPREQNWTGMCPREILQSYFI